MRTCRWIASTLGVVAVLGLAQPALGAEPTPADRETTRALLTEGDRLVGEKDFTGALRAYEGAVAIIAVPTTVIEVARMQEELGLLVEARDNYLRATRLAPVPGEPAPFAVARREAVDLAAKVAVRIPSVIVVVKGAKPGTTPTLAVDGVEVPRAASLLPRKVNPGKHTIAVMLAGYKEVRIDVELKEAETRNVDVALEVDPNAVVPPSDPVPAGPAPGANQQGEAGTSPVVIGAFAAGGVGLAVGSIFGLMSLSRASDAKGYCPTEDHCGPSAQRHIDAATDLANVSNVGFAVALLGAGVGIYVLATQPKARSGSAMIVTPFGARGSF